MNDATSENSDHDQTGDTEHLVRSPENARRITAAIERLENGGGVEYDLVE